MGNYHITKTKQNDTETISVRIAKQWEEKKEQHRYTATAIIDAAAAAAVAAVTLNA